MARVLGCALLAVLGLSMVAAIPTSLNIQAPITVPLLAGMRPNSTSLPIDYEMTATGNQPSEVHLVPAGVGSVYVNWATKNYTVGQGALTPNDPTTSASIVKYGTSPNALTSTASGDAFIYNQIYNTTGTWKGGATAENYTSPILHKTIISGLKPDTPYYYQVGDGTTFSQVYNFTSLQAPGPVYPQTILAIADWGASHNSTVTLQHIVDSATEADSPPVVFYIGDFCYADTWYTNGTASLPTSGFEGAQSSTYQPVWDLWQRMIEPLVSKVPMLTCTGNHEIEEQDDANNTIFASVQARWPVPSNTSVVPSNNYFFYSYEFGPVHSIFLSVYVNYVPGSDQWNWLVKDLLSINRTATPWVIVNFHNPWYTTDPSYKEFEQMRASMEPLLYQAGADVVYYGHVHSYERSYPVNNYEVDPCGTTHITIGDGGNTEGLSFLNATKNGFNFEDFGAGCENQTGRIGFITPTNPTVSDPWSYYLRAFTFQADGNSTGVGNPAGFCYKEQPGWSAYREPSFGHGVLEIVNGTHALWMWHRNQDSEAVAADEVYLIRNMTQCPNKGYPNNRVTNGGMSLMATASV